MIKRNDKILIFLLIGLPLLIISKDINQILQEGRQIEIVRIELLFSNPQITGIHSPIYIDGNTELDNFPNKTGSGTFTDPYIIEDYFINAEGLSSGIEIENTDRYLMIRNCTIVNSGQYDCGIELYHSQHINISFCMVKGNHKGIYLCYSDYNTISDNIVLENSWTGISLSGSEHNILLNNNVFFNGFHGFRLDYSDNNILCYNNASFNDYSGVWVDDSKYTTLSYNVALFNDWSGISLSGSDYNKISYNNVSYNEADGISLSGSDYNNITRNIVRYNDQSGIELTTSQNNNVFENIVSFSNSAGIEVVASCDNMIFENDLSFNDYGIYLTNARVIPTNEIIISKYNNVFQNRIVYSDTAECFRDRGENNEIYDNICTYTRVKPDPEPPGSKNHDTDGDHLSDYDEFNRYHTDPNNPDTDGDNLTDYDEIIEYSTDPNNPDTDGDSLSDYEEVIVYSTDPNNQDTDRDGFSDEIEISLGCDPNDLESNPYTRILSIIIFIVGLSSAFLFIIIFCLKKKKRSI